MNIGDYTIKIDEKEKTIEMKISGTFDDEMASAFHQDYLNKIRPLCTEDFTLNINCLDMDVISKEMLPKLQISTVLYKQSNFKKTLFWIRNNQDIKQQLEKVLMFAGVENHEIIIR